MNRGKRLVRRLAVVLVATIAVVIAGCFTVNCLVDPLWYWRGNHLTDINFPFNERLAKLVRLLPRLGEYDCLILGTSRATLLPEDKVTGHRCYNLAFSDGKVTEYLVYADYLRARGFKPRLLIVDVRRADLIGSPEPTDVPDFVRTGAAPPSMVVTYLTLDALDFSIRTLRGESPHHRYYDKDFLAHLELRSKRRYYNPEVPVKPMAGPTDVHPDRAQLYVELRRKFPEARAIAYLPPESAWRMAALSLTPAFDPYLEAIRAIAAAYDRLLDFSLPSAITLSKDPNYTYDGIHYTRRANEQVLRELLAPDTNLAIDWHRDDDVAQLTRRRLTEFLQQTRAEADSRPAKETRPQ